ncbi:MAG: hypothetical protein ACI97K_002286 [Glaciecola sp.]|jgi:hypothetical protein
MQLLFKLVKLSFIFLAIFIISACGSTVSQSTSSADRNRQEAQSKQQILNYVKADADYKILIAKFEKYGSQASDFDQIIRIYPLTRTYSPYANVEQAQKLIAFDSMEKENWDACLQATSTILEENYTSLTGHYGAMVCHFESGKNVIGEHHNSILDGFIDAIWRSGDGKTPATAFYITSTNDLYAFVQLNGMIATGESLVYHEQRPMDAVTVEDPQTKTESTWYFDVTAQFRRGILDDLESRL